MPLFAPGVSPEQATIGSELVKFLTRDVSDLAPRLAALTPASAEALVVQAARHGVGPLLRQRLIELGLFDALPAAARDALDAQYVAGSARALARYHDLDPILDSLAKAGVPVIALKGIYLAKAVYSEPGLRPMADIDLLFRVPDLEPAQAILFALGYTRAEMERPVTDYLGAGPHLPGFWRPDSSRLEAHMHIESPDAPFAIDLEGIWRRARPWSLNGRSLLALSAEDLLLHLCLHSISPQVPHRSDRADGHRAGHTAGSR